MKKKITIQKKERELEKIARSYNALISEHRFLSVKWKSQHQCNSLVNFSITIYNIIRILVNSNMYIDIIIFKYNFKII